MGSDVTGLARDHRETEVVEIRLLVEWARVWTATALTCGDLMARMLQRTSRQECMKRLLRSRGRHGMFTGVAEFSLC